MLVNKLPVGSLTLNYSQQSLRQKSTFFFLTPYLVRLLWIFCSSSYSAIYSPHLLQCED